MTSTERMNTARKVQTQLHSSIWFPIYCMCAYMLVILYLNILLYTVCNSGMRPPRPAYTPAPNGNLHTCDRAAISHRHHPISKWQTRLQEMLTPSSSRAYAMGCAIVTLLLLTVFLIFYFLGKNTPSPIIYIALYPLKCKHMYQTMSSMSEFHTSSVNLITQNFDLNLKYS